MFSLFIFDLEWAFSANKDHVIIALVYLLFINLVYCLLLF